uniref:PWI domain-containing protein n=1 Tax=Rhizophora mucronata TaxID=61149 RepID=A0A2P2LS02_RHIMU
MSGGFFRGTSADQDTRFSNKQAKLLRSQKFAPELEYLVDTRKVKMDVVRPWIANRVTELLGFEDEVLINFIFGLLDGKEVNGKEVQISLTGFMEKNTGKFMKELWSLLLSAQKNESGVPQQFLDAKAEETQKKQAEADRIMHEIQKKKEKESRELEQERSRKMDGEAKSPAVEPTSKHVLPKDSTVYSTDGEETEKNRMRGRSRHSSSESSRSPSNSRSYSGYVFCMRIVTV